MSRELVWSCQFSNNQGTSYKTTELKFLSKHANCSLNSDISQLRFYINNMVYVRQICVAFAYMYKITSTIPQGIPRSYINFTK